MSEAELLSLGRALLLLLITNAAPVAGARLLGARFNQPLDFGMHLADGRPLLGPSKTVRGVLFAVAASTVAGGLLGLAWMHGALFGFAAMAGDSVSSFIKRRAGLPPGSMAPGLDQIPEAVLPLIVLHAALGLNALQIAIAVAAFALVETLLWMLARRRKWLSK